MGILGKPAHWIEFLAGRVFKDPELPDDFRGILEKGFSVCELGDQWLTYAEHRLAAGWYQELGCGRYVSIDGNGRGTMTADLNRPLNPHPGQSDLVTDFGTGEHIFEQGQVWRTLHSLMKVGGLLIFDRPAQGYPRHSYYRFDMDLYRDIAAANGYDVIALVQSSARPWVDLQGESRLGELVRGVLRRTRKDKFVIPQQGRYKKLLRPITSPRG